MERLYEPKLSWAQILNISGGGLQLDMSIRAPATFAVVGVKDEFPKGEVSDLASYPITVTLRYFPGIYAKPRTITLTAQLKDILITQTHVAVYVAIEGEAKLGGKSSIPLPPRSDGPIDTGVTTVRLAGEDPFPLKKSGSVRASTSDSLGPLLTEPPGPPYTFTAQLDSQPPGKRLTVKGEVWTSSGGWTYAFEVDEQEHRGDDVLVLNLVGTPPAGMAILPLLPVKINPYVEMPPKKPYKRVIIKTGTEDVSVEVSNTG